jgi:hypothetical protein
MTDSTTLTLTILGLIVASIGAYYTFRQYWHQQNHKEKDIIVNVSPEIKINPEIKIPEIPVEKQDEKTIKMDEEYYTKLGVNILRSKKMGDDFDIFETK